jgi:hypothetical protein
MKTRDEIMVGMKEQKIRVEVNVNGEKKHDRTNK